MENEFTQELIEKAKQASSAEETNADLERLNDSGELSDNELDNVSGGISFDGREFVSVIYGTECFNGQFMYNQLSDGKFARDDNHSQRERFRENAHKPDGSACCAYCMRLGFKDGTGYCELSGR